MNYSFVFNFENFTFQERSELGKPSRRGGLVRERGLILFWFRKLQLVRNIGGALDILPNLSPHLYSYRTNKREKV